MPAWAGSTVWKRHSQKLAVAPAEQFKRLVLTYLRVLWPSLQELPVDALGANLAASEGARFSCVVRCQSFPSLDAATDKVVQAAVNDFVATGANTETYVFVHNLDARSSDFRENSQVALRVLLSSGRAARVELWDRQTLLYQVFDALADRLGARLRQHSEQLAARFERLLPFAHVHLPEVPIQVKNLLFKRDAACEVTNVSSRNLLPIHQILLEPTEHRWTLLVGPFGVGKTTAILSAALTSARTAVVVPCSTLPTGAAPPSTNALLREVAKSLDLLSEAEPQDRGVLEDAAGAVLSFLLRQPDSPYSIVLDGLDENRLYSGLTGLQQLSNQLSDLRCPVVLTTRSEHFHAMFGDFNLAFSEFSTKNSPSRPARLFELTPWDIAQSIDLVRRIVTATPVGSSELSHLGAFLDSLRDGTYQELYEELPHHPLFLQFILDEVCEHGLRHSTRATLLRHWAARKIRRDRVPWAGGYKARPLPEEAIDTEDFIAKMLRLMENVAAVMVERAAGAYQLVEWTESLRFEEEAGRLFAPAAAQSSNRLLSLLLNSLLISRSPREGSFVQVAFVLRVFQEYFLAAYLRRSGLLADGYPPGVQSFWSELAIDASSVTAPSDPSPGVKAAHSDFDVFVAHSSHDKAAILTIAGALRACGLRPWLDREGIRPGEWLQDSIQTALLDSKTAAIFIGPRGLGPWQHAELRALITRCVTEGIHVIPVLLPGVTEIPHDLPLLRELKCVQFQTAEDPIGLADLIWGITGRRSQTGTR